MAIFEFRSVRLELDIPPSVYEPSDDTRMLSEATMARCTGEVLELGCGSGAVSIALAKQKNKNQKLEILACDISPEAIAAAKKNAAKNKIKNKIRFVASDLFSAVPASKKFDWILFNPPYLPTAKAEKVKGALNAALDGGPDGLRVVRKFLAQAKKHLQPKGRILLVVSSLQPQDKLLALLAAQGFAYRIVAQEHFFFEKLQVWEMEQRAK